jgi:hypothetical protein
VVSQVSRFALVFFFLTSLIGAGCGKGGSVTAPDIPEAVPTPRPDQAFSTRPYWPLDVGEVWHFVREDEPSMRTDIAVVEDENGCKALHFVKNDVRTYHAVGQPSNNFWHVAEMTDGLYAANCRGTFEKDAYPDDQRFHMQTGLEMARTWFIGSKPYFLMPWTVRSGDEFHGRQDYWTEWPDGRKGLQQGGNWDVKYDLMPNGQLRLSFNEDSWSIGEDWWLAYGEGPVMIERWTDMSRTKINVRLVRR